MIALKKIVPHKSDHPPSLDGLPSVFYIETVLACNLACPQCVIGRDEVKRVKKILKLDQFIKISNKIRDTAKLVYLHKWGEPMMNKDIFSMVNIVSDYAHAHISTNGILLDENKIEKLFMNGLGTLIISIDGVSQEVYEKYRIGGEVSQVLKNIELASKIFKKLKATVKIIPQFIVFEHNYHQIEDFKNFCLKLDLMPVFKKPYIRFNDTKVKESSDNFYHRVKYTNKKEHYEAISKCDKVFSVMTITADGTVLLCPQDYNGDFNLGNILKDNKSLKDLWFEPRFSRIRNQIINKNPLDLCINKCMIYNKNY